MMLSNRRQCRPDAAKHQVIYSLARKVDSCRGEARPRHRLIQGLRPGMFDFWTLTFGYPII